MNVKGCPLRCSRDMTRKATIIGVFFTLLASGILAQNLTEEELTIQRQLIEGQKFLMLKEYDKALDVLNDAYQTNDQNAAVLWAISRVQVGKKDYERAKSAILKAIEMEPDNNHYLEHFTTILRRNRDFKRLAETYGQLSALQPKNDKYAFQQVKYLEKIKEYKTAMKVLNKRDSDDVNPQVVYRKALLYESMGQPKKAVKEYGRMIEAFPSEVRYLHMLAAHYQGQNQNEQAVETYERILKLDPDDSKAALAISNQVKESGDNTKYLTSIRKIILSPAINIDIKMKELIPYVQKVDSREDDATADVLQEYADSLVNIHPREAKAYALKADLHNLRQQTEEARQAYDKAVKLDPSVYPVWEQYLFTLAELKDYRQLEKQAENAIDYFPNRGRLFFFSGVGKCEREKYADAYEELMQASMMVGRNVKLKYDVLQLLGMVSHKLEKSEESRKYYDEALKIYGQDPKLLAGYAQVLAEQNHDLDKASGLIEQASLIDSRIPEVVLAQSSLFITKGQNEEAISLLKSKVTSLRSPALWNKLGDVYWSLDRKSEAKAAWEEALKSGGNQKIIQKKIDKAQS